MLYLQLRICPQIKSNPSYKDLAWKQREKNLKLQM